MKRFIPFWSCILLVMGAVSCQKPAAISAPDSLTFTVDGTGQTFTLLVNRDWRITASESWCSTNPKSGVSSDDPVTVTVTCQPNTSYDERDAVLTIETDEISHTIRIVQAQKDGILSDTNLLRAGYQAQDLVIPAETNVDFTVSVLKGDDWIKPLGTKGLVRKEVSIHLEENRSGAVREGTVMLVKSPASYTFQVRQAPWNAVLDHNVPGIYGLGGKNYVYEPGISQLSTGKTSAGSFFRILYPDPPRVLSVEGISGVPTLTESIPLSVRLISGDEGTLYQTSDGATVLRESDSLLWLLLSGDTGLILKK